MAANDSFAQSAVTAADPSRPFAVRPLIADLLHTRFFVQGSVLLVEAIESHIPVSKRYRAIRLLLGDGELCMQALLRPELHGFVDSGQVFVGCYVRLDRVEVKTVLTRSTYEARGAGLQEPEEMIFLVARDLSVVGWDTAYMQMAGTTLHGQSTEAIDPDLGIRKERPVAREGELPKAQGPLVPAESVVQSRTAVSDESTESCTDAESQQPRTGASASTYTNTDNLPWATYDLSKPLRLTPLKSIPNLPYKQNWVVNVLAVVASLSDVEPAGLPPFKQRTARLADPSTSKQVHLTVFLDADGFAPAVGSVVLLLGVKNHRFDGGSLKKYGNEKIREGSIWWLENPRDVDWCDVDGLKKWWSDTTS